MKPTYFLLALALLPTVGAMAQAPSPSPSPSPTPSVSTPAEPDAKAGHKGHRKQMMESLTPEEREKLKAARQAAMEDPQVKTAEATRAANPRGYRQAMREAMLRKDPSVGAILDKMKSERKQDRIF